MSKYLQRCYEIARLAGKHVKSNPQVGAVIVYEDRIIGEGYHQSYGEAHAEVNAINSVADTSLLSKATLYVSLEPCCHTGKTPPCADLIIKSGIPRVHIGTKDPSEKVSGKGIHRLEKHGVEVTLHDDLEARALIHPFIQYNIHKRPYITIKFAQSKDFFMGKKNEQVWLSNAYSKVLAHDLRSQNDAILVGTQTAITDNPALTTREVPGAHPVRFVIDKNQLIPSTHHLLSDDLPTVVFNGIENKTEGVKTWVKVEDEDYGPAIVDYAFQNQLPRLLVEGGATLINSFTKNKLWDEAYVIDTPVSLGEGIKAPQISGKLKEEIKLGDNSIKIISRL